MNREFLDHLEACKGDLIGLCRGLVRDRGDLEDAVQESIVQGLRAWPRFTSGTNFRSWLLRVATLTVYNLNRKRRPVPTADPGPDPAPEVQLGLEEAYGHILEDPDRIVASLGPPLKYAVGSLPEAERSVFLLRSLCEMKYQDIASTLGMPLGSVMGYLGRARVKLRRALAECRHEV